MAKRIPPNGNKQGLNRNGRALFNGIDVILNRDSVTDALCQGHFIGIFELAPKGNAPGYGGDFYRGVFQ